MNWMVLARALLRYALLLYVAAAFALAVWSIWHTLKDVLNRRRTRP